MKHDTIGTGGLYECTVSPRGTDYLQKDLDGIIFLSFLCIMYIKVVFISAALLCLQRYTRKRCIAAVP